MTSSNYFVSKPLKFSRKNYAIWANKMKTHLKACDLWKVLEIGKKPTPLLENPSLAQIRYYNENNVKKYKALFFHPVMCSR